MIGTDEALTQLRAAGLLVESLNTDGALHRVAVESDKGRKTSGWYVLHTHSQGDGIRLFGAFGNFKNGGEAITLKLDWRGMSEAEQAAARQRMDEARAKQRALEAETHAQAAQRAEKLWGTLPEDGSSEYLRRKGVNAHGIKFAKGGAIAVPVRTHKGAMRGLQFIQPNGDKRFLSGTAKRGCFHVMRSFDPSKYVVLAEGYATAASIHKATGFTCVVVFDAGNIKPVLQILKKHRPDHTYIVAGDDDPQLAENVGMLKASATSALGALVVIAWASHATEGQGPAQGQQ